MGVTADIKTMQLYPRAERILVELRARGLADDVALRVEDLTPFDQLHYHGTEALDAAIERLGIGPEARVLEIGSGWGGPARYLAARTGARVTAVELQEDYHSIGAQLSTRAGLGDRVTHVRGDFLTVDLPRAGFTHCVSWLALYHIPDRPVCLAKAFDLLAPGGAFWDEDLVRLAPLPPQGDADLARYMFANSLVDPASYDLGLVAAGFDDLSAVDMTDNWRAFTAERLAAFREGADAYQARHGAEGRRAIQMFYEKVAGYFADGVIGGTRAMARKL